MTIQYLPSINVHSLGSVDSDYRASFGASLD